jgi:hypothetical protein
MFLDSLATSELIFTVMRLMQAYYTLVVSLECNYFTSIIADSSPNYPSKRTQNPGYSELIRHWCWLSSTMYAPVSCKTEAKGLNETYDASVMLVSHITALVSYTELQSI